MQADVVIGADGASSRVRHWLTETRPAYTGITFLEGWIDEPLRPQAELVGRGTLFSFGGTEAIVAQRNGGGRICVYAAVRRSREWLRQEIASAGAVALVRCLYQSWAPGLRTLLMACEDFTERPIYSLPQDFSWPPRRGITLIGDAAHLMPPLGVGVNLAMLDAADVASALCDASDWHSAVREAEVRIGERARALMPAVIEGFQQWFASPV